MSWSLIHADVLTGLASLRTGSVHQMVTSPPYYGLRDYHGVPETAWGGDPDCCHRWGREERGARKDMLPREESLSRARVGTDERQGIGPPSGGRFCRRCGAWLGKLGLEPSPDLYVEHMVEICRELRRVLRPDGSMFLNLGDKYGGGGSGPEGDLSTLEGTRNNQNEAKLAAANRRHRIGTQGDLLSIPHRVAHALQADGWCLRSTIVWHKPCPMPESITGWRWERCRVRTDERAAREGGVTGWKTGDYSHGDSDRGHHQGTMAQFVDCPGCPKCEPTDGLVLRRGRWRPTTAHEYVFLLSPGPGPYFGDGEAVREAVSGGANSRGSGLHPKVAGSGQGIRQNRSYSAAVNELVSARNPRTVWEIGPEPYQGAHYASYPTALPRRCIQAGTSPAVCAECGAPHAPVVESHRTFDGVPLDGAPRRGSDERGSVAQGVSHARFARETKVLAYRPTCQCGAGTAQAIVLDPFAGTGTTGVAALQLGRRFVGIDLSLTYLVQDARPRVGIDPETTQSRIKMRKPRMPEISGPLFGAEP